MSNSWNGFVIAGLLGLAYILANKWKDQDFITLSVLVLMSAIYAPLGIIVGIVVLLRFVTSNPKVFAGGATGMFNQFKKTFGG